MREPGADATRWEPRLAGEPPDHPVSMPSVSAGTTVVGVIGNPVAHSLSPALHNAAFAGLGLDWVSVGFPVAGGSVDAALAGARALGIRGLSVTMPHKAAVAASVDRRTPIADRLGAVNCVTNRDGVLVGDNTDGPGFVAALRHGVGFDPAGARCLVVGAGGAARAVVAGLADAGASEIVVVNRSHVRALAAAAIAGSVGRAGDAEDARGCDLVVNATPLGMAAVDGARVGTARQGEEHAGPVTVGGSPTWPVDPAHLRPGHVVVDLVYHPAVTPWLAAARSEGATVMNGLGMLVHQAVLQLQTWTGLEPPIDVMWHAVTRHGAAGPGPGTIAGAETGAEPETGTGA